LAKEARCPYCLDALVGEDPVVRCVLCRTPHHKPCFDENGGCVAFGCGSVVAGAAGHSILLRRGTLDLGVRWTEVPIVPIEGALARSRPARRFEVERLIPLGDATVRLEVERTRLYPGQDLRARVVLALPQETRVKRLEIVISEEPRAPSGVQGPRRVSRVTLLGRPPLRLASLFRAVGALARRPPRLEAGLHPFELELPGFYGRIIAAGMTVNTTVAAVLERRNRPAIASPEVAIEPAWGIAAEAAEIRGARGPVDRAEVAGIPVRTAPGEQVEFPGGAWPRVPNGTREDLDELIGAPRSVSIEASDPPGEPGGARRNVVVVVRKRDPSEPAAPPPGPAALAAWPAVPPEPSAPLAPPPSPGEPGFATLPFSTGGLAGPRTGRFARVRFEPRRELAPLRLSLEVARPPTSESPTVEFLVDAPVHLRSLELAARYELASERGGDIVAGAFPLTDQLTLVGAGALDPARTGRDTISVRIGLDRALLEEARALAATARLESPELVVRLAVDGVSWEGSLVASGTRVVRLPLGRAPLEDASL
jgi:hypothetical protein